MVLCQFYLKGHCKFGDRCRNEHPPGIRQFPQNNTWSNPTVDKVVAFSIESMLKDFDSKVDKPLWKFSSYGPAKCEPVLIPGLDESPEEFRVKAITALRAGDANGYLKYEAEKAASSDAAYANARTHVAQAFETAKNQSIQGSTISPPPSSNPDSSAASTSAFGQTPAFGSMTTNNSAFGGPALGAFGSTSSVAGFGTSGPTPSSSLGGGSTSAFGNLSTSTPAFGKPAFGQPAFGQSGFGTTPTNSTAVVSVFGHPASVFGQATLPSSAFGNASGGSAFGSANPSTLIKPATTGAFGNTGGSGGGAFGAFAGGQASAFGIPASASTPSSVFGGNNNQTNAFGTNIPPNSSSFSGQPSSAASAFGNSTFGSSGGNASTSAFSGNSTPGGAFGALANNTTQPIFGAQPITGGTAPLSVFSSQQPATSAFAAVPGSGASAFGQPSTSGTGGAFSALASTTTQSAFGAPTSSFPSTKSVLAGGGRMLGSGNNTTSVFGQARPSPIPSKTRAASGPPNFSSTIGNAGYIPGANKYDSLLPPNYLQLLPGQVKDAFEGEKFTWGKIPEWIPPLELR